MHPSQTTVYKWNPDSTIAQMEVLKTKEGKHFIRLTARQGLEDGALEKLPRDLHRFGFQNVYADAPNGQNMLVLSKVRDKDTEKLLSILKDHGFVSAESPVLTHQEDKEKEGLWNYIQNNSLKLSGKIGSVGHAALFAAGALQGDVGRLIAAPLGFTNPLLLSAYGNGKDDIDFEDMVKDMGQYFRAQGVPMPEFTGEVYKRNLLQATQHFIATHPIQIGCGLGSVGSAAMIKSGLGDGSIARMAAGSMSLAGNMAVLGVKEKGSEENNGVVLTPVQKVKQATGDLAMACLHPKHLPAAFGNFLRTGPLMFNGMLNFVDNIFYLADAMHQRKSVKGWTGNQAVMDQKEAEIKALRDPKQNQHAVNNFEQKLLKAKLKKSQKPADMSWVKSRLFDRSIEKEIAGLTEQVDFYKGLSTEMAKEGSKFPASTAANLKKASIMVDEVGVLNRQLKISESAKWRPAYLAMQLLPFVTAASFTVATALSTMSSKNRTAKPEEDPVFDKLYSLTAQMIVQLPKAQQTEALHRMSDYLTTRDELREVGVTSSLFEKLVQKRIDAMEHTPWVAKYQDAAANSNIHQSAATVG